MSKAQIPVSDKSELLRSIFDLRKWWNGSVRFIANAEDDGTTDDKDDKSAGDDGKTDDKDDKSTGSADADATIKDPEKKKLSEEAAAHRVRAKALQKERDELATKLKGFEDKDRTEVEKLTNDTKVLTEDRDKWKKIATEQGLELSFLKSGAAAILKRPDQALRLIDLKSVEPDDEGNYDHKALLKLAEDFVKENPHYALTGNDDEDTDNKESSGRPANTRKTKDQSSKETLAKLFPALQGRT